MSYNPVNWVNGETPINDINLNNMDQGIADAHSMLAEHESQINDFVNQQLPEEYVKEAVDTYVENNSAGFATAADLAEAKSQLDSVNSEVDKLSGEIDYLGDLEYSFLENQYMNVNTSWAKYVENEFYNATDKIDITGISKVKFPIYYASGAGVATFFANGKPSRTFNNSNGTFDEGTVLEVEFLEGETHIAISVYKTHVNDFWIKKIQKSNANLIEKSNAMDLYSLKIIEGEYFSVADNGKISANTGYARTDFLNLDLYTFDTVSIYINHTNIYAVAFFDYQKNFISGVASDYNGVLEIPENSKFVAFSFRKETLYKQRVYYTKSVYGNELIDKLSGKYIVSFGDSIMRGDGNDNVGIGDLLSRKYKCTNDDFAIGGCTVAVVEGSQWNIINQFTDRLVEPYTNADIVLFDGMANDAYHSTTVGEITEGYDAELDTSTFCGGFEYICKTLQTAFIGKKLFYVRVHKMKSRTIASQELYGGLAVEICKKWSIPVVNLYDKGMLNTWLAEHSSAYTNNNDGTHPNELGYLTFYIDPIANEIALFI